MPVAPVVVVDVCGGVTDVEERAGLTSSRCLWPCGSVVVVVTVAAFIVVLVLALTVVLVLALLVVVGTGALGGAGMVVFRAEPTAASSRPRPGVTALCTSPPKESL